MQEKPSSELSESSDEALWERWVAGEDAAFDGRHLGAINELFIAIQAAHLQKREGTSLDGERRSVLRANLIRQRLRRQDAGRN